MIVQRLFAYEVMIYLNEQKNMKLPQEYEHIYTTIF